MTLATPQETEIIGLNAAAINQIARAAATLASSGEDELATRYVQAAARVGYVNQPGGFALPAVEAVIAQIAASQFPAWTPAPTGGPRERVLHVLTESYNTGGHTRQAERWIARDTEREHVVALTRQAEPAQRMRECVAHRDVQFVSVGGPDAPMLERAHALRRLAETADLIVLHIHPDDAVSAIALQPGAGRPPTIFVNHASCDPWIGTSLGDAVACLRAYDAQLAHERRGIAQERTVVLPLPVSSPTGGRSRAELRAAYGIADDAEVVITAARPDKFLPLTADRFAEELAAAVVQRENAYLLVVGPTPQQAPWAACVEAAPQRVQCLGQRLDLTDLLVAADVFVESYPLSGTTISLEAGLADVPMLTYRAGQLAGGILEYEPVGEDLRVHADGPAGLVDGLARMLDDRDWARARAARFGEELRRDHTGDGWRAALEAVYARATALAGRNVAAGPPPQLGVVDDVTAVMCRHNLQGRAQPPAQIAAHAAALELAAHSPVLRTLLPDLLGPAPCPLPHQAVCALAVPAVDGSDAPELLAGLRELYLAGMIASCAIAVPAAHADAMLATLEPVLQAQDAASGVDLPVDVLPIDGDEPLMPNGWIAVATADCTREWHAGRPLHTVASPGARAAAA